MPDSRFIHPYYLLNTGLLLSYVILRLQRLSPGELVSSDMFGVTREAQIYFCLAMMLFTRALSAPTLDVYIASAFMFSRVTVLLCLWYMHLRMFAIFAALWALLYVVCPQPRYRLPTSITKLNNVSFNDRIAANNHRTIYVLWCYATWSARCTQLSPVLATLVNSYRHPRVQFASLDVAKFPAVAEKLGVSISAASKQLPTVICFRRGTEVSRIPVVDSAGRIPKQWSMGFTAVHVAQELNLDTQFDTAKKWEADARQRLLETKSQ